MTDIEIRAATEADMPEVVRIYAYYIASTVISFHEEPEPVESFVAKYHSCLAGGLPYLVAVRPGTASVLAYGYVAGFRWERTAYRFTTELSLYCDNEYTGQGIGSRMLTALVGILKEPGTFTTAYGGHYPDGVVPCKPRHLLSLMSLDEKGPRGGMALKEFYERHGFVLRGHHHQLGYKFNRWVDLMELQLSLYK